MNRLVILPYKMSSLSSKTISKHFNTFRIFPNRNYRPRKGDVVLNWGFGGSVPVLEMGNQDFTILNKPFACDRASDKIATLRLLKQNNVPHVDFVLNQAAAKAIVAGGDIIYCRTLTRGREGKGIVLARQPEDVVEAKLYTRYFPNDHEFRIHVFNGEVIDEVEKKKMSKERMKEMGIEFSEDSKYIRNLKKAWSFCRQDIEVPNHVREIAIKAVKALDLDFGGVDIAYNSETNEAKVLEINTACGQTTGTTTHLRYTRAISKYLNIPFTVEEYNKRYNCNAETYIR